jgi:hypothetical protein
MPAGVLSNAVYLKNIAALWRRDPRLAYEIDDWGEPRGVVVEPARSGAPTAVACDEQGRRVYLHSRHDPEAEAERLVANVKLEGYHCFVVTGLGLGHHLKALHKRTHGEALLVVGEPSLDVIAAAMFSVDLSEVLASERCVFLTRLEKDYVYQRLESHGTTIMLGTQFVSHPPSERIAGAFLQAVRGAMTDYITYARMCLVTVVANSRITCRNVACNLPAYLSTPPIDPLRERFAGFPAVVVSAGPSLARNIDQLVELQDRAVIIAVQTTLKPLLARGIRPHFVTSLDFHEISKNFFDGLSPEAVADVHLVAEPKATWHVIDTYRAYNGMISLLDNAFARQCIGDELAARDGLKAGATVAHLAFYLAEYMGCDPILFVGQDLAYSDNTYYTPGVAIHDTWRPELNRFNTIEMKEWERIVRARNILRKIKGIHGEDLYTDEQLFTYLQQFEKDFAASRARLIDATEGGARKAGTTVMTLADAAKQFCASPIPRDRLEYRRQLKWYDAGRLEHGRAALTRRMDDVRLLRDRSQACVGVLKELVHLTDRPAEFNRKLARVDELRTQIQQQEHTYQMISLMAQQAELRRFRADRRMELDAVEGVERAKRQLARDIEFAMSIVEGAEALLAVMEEAQQRFDQAIEAHEAKRATITGGNA